MDRKISLFILSLFVVIILCFARGRAQAQSSLVPSRITAAIDETKLAVLHGNTYPLARASFDRGPAADSLQMDRMFLVLQRSPAQEAALQKLLADQQDKSSANYHRWLTPDEFGEQFGVSDQDIAKVSGWLQSHGFQLDGVSRGRDLITFSGNAAQVRSAFHTSIHQYVVNNREHISNNADPAIPAALTPVVAGVRSLNDFFPTPKHIASAAHGLTGKINPHLTLTDANGNTFFGVGPTDFATIYNILPLWNSGIDGTGVTIAVVSASDINTTDVDQFRTIFGLPAIKFTKVIPPTSTDPGIQAPSANGGPDGDEDETEAIFDVEWSGSVAKNANIDLVASKDTVSTAGIDLSAEYIVDTMSPTPPILSESYGNCELGLGVSGNTFYNNLWSRAASEGITVSISTGDNGSDGCDFPPTSTTATGPQEGIFGLGVNGIASTPFNIAVGGTDFNDHTAPNGFWNSPPDANASGTLDSAVSYVPELAWNDSCTNSLIYQAFGESSAAVACNANSVQNDGNKEAFFFVSPVGGSGGKSSCTTANTSETADCTGGYSKPLWQAGVGVPGDGARDLPDISFFAEGSGDSLGLEDAIGDDNAAGSFYFACEEDLQGTKPPTACSTSGAFILGGGTSISAQVFAGVMALIDQKTSSSQGNINTSFYSLAAGQSGLNCNSSSTITQSDARCIFHDVTTGTNAMPCLTPSSHDGTTDCSTAGGGPIGVLTGYNAGTGYDEVTGLGSINVANLAGALPYISISDSPTTVSVSSPGQTGTTTLTFSAQNGYTGTVDLACSNLPRAASCAFTQNGNAVSSVTLTNVTTTASVLLTVSTTANSAVPVRFEFPGRKIPGSVVLLAGSLLGAICFFGLRGGQRRWAPAFAIFGLGMLVACAGCGGGAGGSTGTPTGTTTAKVTMTNPSNNNVISFDFSLSVD